MDRLQYHSHKNRLWQANAVRRNIRLKAHITKLEDRKGGSFLTSFQRPKYSDLKAVAPCLPAVQIHRSRMRPLLDVELFIPRDEISSFSLLPAAAIDRTRKLQI